jgi:hypothetical protein
LAWEILSRFRKMRRAQRAPGRPYIRLTLFPEKEDLARPTQELRCASWFLLATPLLLSRAPPEIQ